MADLASSLLAAPETAPSGPAIVIPSGEEIDRWAEANFYINDEEATLREGKLVGRLIRLYPHQKAVLRYFFTRREDGRFPFSTLVYSTIKKSGKSTIAAVIARWFAEREAMLGHIYAMGNDLKQARERSFEEMRNSIILTPGYDARHDRLPDRWALLTNSMTALATRTKVEAASIDAPGEAGGHPNLSIWTELWGFERQDAVRFYQEMTPIPTARDSIRLVETYSGYEDESVLLRTLYEQGRDGRQLTNGELAAFVARDRDGERYEDFLYAWAETNGDPNALVPIWVDESAGLGMYWDSGYVARRMPWQQGERGEAYYREQEATLLAGDFRRMHLNEWAGSEDRFVPIELWDACYDPDLPPLVPGDRTPLIIAMDAASTGDCFGIVAVTRHPNDHSRPAIRAVKKWDPPKGGRILYEGYACPACHGPMEYDEQADVNVVAPAEKHCKQCGAVGPGRSSPYEFIRWCRENFNVHQVPYDPHQLESLSQRIRHDLSLWAYEFDQGSSRLRADRKLYDLIVQKQLAHNGDQDLRQHVMNANIKLQKDQDSTMRLVKRTEGRKIDLAVAASMAIFECMRLLL